MLTNERIALQERCADAFSRWASYEQADFHDKKELAKARRMYDYWMNAYKETYGHEPAMGRCIVMGKHPLKPWRK